MQPNCGSARKGKKNVLLSGGNPQIGKAEGDAPVQAYIAAIPGWKQDVGRRLDALIARTVPNVYKAVKWNSPLYGIECESWFLSIHCFKKSNPSKRTCATSTFAKTPRSTKLNSSIG
jgi:hypothetical protein